MRVASRPSRAPTFRTRPARAHDPRHPVHVTLRAARGLKSLRSEAAFQALSLAFAAARREDFRVLHFSVQTDHVHLIVEADAADGPARRHQRPRLSHGPRAQSHLAPARQPCGATGYHARALTTPREVRNGLVYVLLNFRKHLRAPPGIDPRSSGAWFDGWSRPNAATQPCPVAPARTWLATAGWRRAGGPIDTAMHAGSPAPRQRVPNQDGTAVTNQLFAPARLLSRHRAELPGRRRHSFLQ